MKRLTRFLTAVRHRCAFFRPRVAPPQEPAGGTSRLVGRQRYRERGVPVVLVITKVALPVPGGGFWRGYVARVLLPRPVGSLGPKLIAEAQHRACWHAADAARMEARRVLRAVDARLAEVTA